MKYMKKIIVIIALCAIPFVAFSQNYYKNSINTYYNMDTVSNIFSDSINLPVLEVSNPKLLKMIDKCVKNYEENISSTPDSLGSYFVVNITYHASKFYFGLTIAPESNFYKSQEYDAMKTFNRSYRELSLDYIQDSYYGCFYYKGYLFIVRRYASTNIWFFKKLFNETGKDMDIMIYKTPYGGFYGDDNMYIPLSHSYEIWPKKNGGFDIIKYRKRE